MSGYDAAQNDTERPGLVDSGQSMIAQAKGSYPGLLAPELTIRNRPTPVKRPTLRSRKSPCDTPAELPELLRRPERTTLAPGRGPGPRRTGAACRVSAF